MEDVLKKKIITVCAAVLFLTALGLTLYPLISNYVNQKYASEIQTAYQVLIQQTDESVLQEAKQRAVAYNLAITPGTADAYGEEALLSAAENYDNQLDIAGNGIMGYVEIPKIQVNLPIYHGTDAEVLDRGVGHLLGSSLPVGGKNTHTILSGHSGMASQKMFAVPGVLLPNSCGSKHKRPGNSSGTTPDQQPLQILGFPCGCSRFHTGSFFFHYRRFLVRNPGAAYQEPVGVDPIGSAGDEGTQVLTGDDT